MVSKINKKAFTLIEAIIVTGLIFILIAGIVIIINPQEYLMKARDDQREMHLNALNQVIQQLARRQDWPCDPIPEEITLIGSAIGQYDLYSCPDFLAQPVYDPRVGYFNNLGDYFTGYEIKQNSETKRISLYAQEGELRLVYLGEKLGIYTWADLDDIRNDLSGEHTLMVNLDKNSVDYDFIAGPLANDGQGWEPIGVPANQFTGNFEGNGYTISDLYINRSTTNYIGLFGYIASGSEIKNIGLVNVNILGYSYVAGLVGFNAGTIYNSYNKGGNIEGLDMAVGGLTAWNDGIITNSYNTTSIFGTQYVGGISGINFASIFNCYSIGFINSFGNSGGLVGLNFGMAVVNSFYDLQTSNQSDIGKGTPRTTIQMQDIRNYNELDWEGSGLAEVWDIIEIQDHSDEIWYIDNNNDYPRLWFEK